MLVVYGHLYLECVIWGGFAWQFAYRMIFRWLSIAVSTCTQYFSVVVVAVDAPPHYPHPPLLLTTFAAAAAAVSAACAAGWGAWSP